MDGVIRYIAADALHKSTEDALSGLVPDNWVRAADFDVAKQRVSDLEAALRFYADRDHYSTDDGLNWDSCSGEPANILWHEDQPWFIEDGSIARAALNPNPDCMPEPEPCSTCLGGGIEYDGAGHTCTACNGTGAPAVERQEPKAEYFEVVAEMRQQSLTRAWGKIRALRDENKQLQARIAELENGRGEPVAWMTRCIKGAREGVVEQVDGPDDVSNLEYWSPSFPVYAATPAPAAVVRNAQRYEYLRERDLETIKHGGVFAGLTPDNLVLNGEDLDAAIDACLDATASLNKKPTTEVKQ